MKHMDIWIADDGATFSEESDCIKYENEKEYEGLNGACVCMDTSQNVINPLLGDNASRTYYVNLKTKEAVAWWKKYYGTHWGYDTEGIIEPGCYAYEGDWQNVTKILEHYQTIQTKLEEA